MEKLVFKNSYNLFLLKPSSKISTQKFSLKAYKKLLEVKFFCIFLPLNQKLVLKYCIFIEIDSNFSNFIPIKFDKFFETGKFEVKSHIVHCIAERIAAIRDFPTPDDTKKLKSFLWLSNQLGHFVPDLNHSVNALIELLKTNVAYQLLPDQENAFQTTKDILTSKLVLKTFYPNFETELITDASLIGLGLALLQVTVTLFNVAPDP